MVMMLQIPEYWKAVARLIEAKDQQAKTFLKHKPSLGAAREAILRELLIERTPSPFVPSTGFICAAFRAVMVSKQCDVLVYDPTENQPYISIAGFVVVPKDSERLVVEVKTALNASTFREILAVWNSLNNMSGKWPCPVMSFAFSGMSFPTFVKSLMQADTSAAGIPDCFAVHRQNYLAIRSLYRLANPTPNQHRPAKYCMAVNFGTDESASGSASAWFLYFYDLLLRKEWTRLEAELPGWFDKLQLPQRSKVCITEDGELRYGRLSVEPVS